jgi:hypothetical protein
MGAAMVRSGPRAEVELRFTPRNEELVRLGLKTATIRRTQHGQVGDTFRAAGERWEILAIVPTTLGQAAANFFRLEGEISPRETLEWWARAYGISQAQVDVRQPVYVHLFGWISATSS